MNNICTNPEHWENMMIDGRCFSCEAEFVPRRDRPLGLPSDDEIDAMHERSQTDSEAYRLAH